METDFKRRYVRSEDGSIVIFSLFLFIMLVMAAGFAVDLMRTELRRVDLQNTADTAALASSSLDQSLSPQDVANSYFEKAGFSQDLFSVDVANAANGNTRSVEIRTFDRVPTIFGRFYGVPDFPVATGTIAEQSATDIEISIVLDISSSMNSNNRLPRLKEAVIDFINLVVPEDPLSSASEISISLIPYSITTNPGDIAKYYTLDDKHDYNNCVFFTAENYAGLEIVPTIDIDPDNPPLELERHTHFADNSSGFNEDGTIDLPYCPIHNPIVVMETERQPLIDAVNALQGWDGTGIDVGVKWGIHLLDPSFQSVAEQMITNGELSDRMIGRPVAYAKPELNDAGLREQISRKILIIMSDGENNEQRDLPERMRTGPSEVYRSATTGNYSVLMLDGRDDPDFDETNDTISRWYHEETDEILDHPDIPGATSGTDWTLLGADGEPELVNLEWPDVMNIARANDVANRFFRTGRDEGFIDAATFNEIQGPIFHRISPTDTNQRMHDLCALAHGEGVINQDGDPVDDIEIYGISFEAPTDLAANTIKNCTSNGGNPSNFFPVNGTQITAAFQDIARQISQLRLSN